MGFSESISFEKEDEKKKKNISMPAQQDRGRNDRRIKLIIKPKDVWFGYHFPLLNCLILIFRISQ